MIALLAAIPLRFWIAGGLLAAGLAYGVSLKLETIELERDLSEEKTLRAFDQTRAAEDAAARERQYRAKEQALNQNRDEVVNDAIRKTEAAASAVVASNVASEQLRQRIATLVAAGRAAKDPGAARPGAAAGDPIGVLADVLGRADTRAGVLAAYADRARTAGQACEQLYDAVAATPARSSSAP